MMIDILLFIGIVGSAILIAWWIDNNILIKFKWWRRLKQSDYENKLEDLNVMKK